MASTRARATYRVSTQDDSSKKLLNIQNGFREVGASAAILAGPLNAISGRFTALGATVGRVGPGLVAVGVAIAGSVAGLKAATSAAGNFEREMLRVEGLLRATENASGLTAKEIDQLARELDKATLASASEARQAAAALLTFRSVGTESFKAVLFLAQDMSEAIGGDLRQNVIRLGRALEDPSSGLAQLVRSGVSFETQHRSMILAMSDLGREAEVETEILRKLEGQVGGAGEEAGGGLTGKIDLLKFAFLDLLEAFGDRTGALEGAAHLFAGMANNVTFLRNLLFPDELARFNALIADRVRLTENLRVAAEEGSAMQLKFFQDELDSVNAQIRAVESLREQEELRRAGIREEAAVLERRRAAEKRAAKDASERKKNEQEEFEARRAAVADDIRETAAFHASQRRRQDSISGVITGLIDEENALIHTRAELVSYRLQVLEADAGQVQFARSMVESIEQLERQQQEAEQAKDVARELGLTFSSSFEDAALSGERFSDVLIGLGRDLQRLILRLTITKPLLEDFTGGFEQSQSGGGGIFESIGGGLSGLLSGFGGGGGGGGGLAPALSFAGPFASGGTIPAGSFGIAGEKGPEPVFGPATVFPNDALGGVVNNLTQVFNIEGTPAPGVEEIIEEAAARGAARGFAMMQSNIARGKGMARLVGAR